MTGSISSPVYVCGGTSLPWCSPVMDTNELNQYLEKSTAASGVPLVVADSVVLDDIAAML